MKDIPDCIISRVRTAFASLGTITTRSQFGGYSVAADKVMFGLILDGELYLRGTRQSEHIFLAQQMSQLLYTKRGIPVLLNYYLVNQRLWAADEVLMSLSLLALEEAKRHLHIKAASQRLKDLPNIGQAIERLLWKAGIQDIEALRHYGAKSSYLKLRAIKENLDVKVLLALEGALAGRHLAALPQGQRSELLAWFKRLSCQ
ncbi:TfoX/Sxy family DNA transformation protein [Acerihabitans sp. TG2]|uniref:TfoX/Sxy family DNA transformation protein n=1 Tax=Acerihabitans sp. TG2 TaxID=3096008 RepID=UPI002B23A17C|nr:TfoX/Sxy family DNA transformation protein [Acerihabitans sp. TG2]MEA9390683.1 TfoX/Sxy family DNA transformation protein [Acerihabitans sp. TG2]